MKRGWFLEVESQLGKSFKNDFPSWLSTSKNQPLFIKGICINIYTAYKHLYMEQK